MKDLSRRYGFLRGRHLMLAAEHEEKALPTEEKDALKGRYYDTYLREEGSLLVSKVKKEDFWRDVFWRQRNELFGIFKEMGYDPSARDLIEIVQESCIINLDEGTSIDEYYDTVVGLSNEHFVKHMRRFRDGAAYLPERNALGSEPYSHTEHFAWIYFNELKVIENLCRARPVSVLELGSSFGHSIFSKIAMTDAQSAQYFGIDKNADLVSIASRYALSNHLRNASFRAADAEDPALIKGCFHTTTFDVVTSSHLLEHIEGPAQKNIEDWLSLAEHALVLSVPFDGPNSYAISGHKHHFTRDCLERTSGDLQNRLHLTADESNIDAGILTLYKTGGGQDRS